LPLGSHTSWARDFALVGAASSLLTPTLFSFGHLPLTYIALTGASGAALGALVGGVSQRLLLRQLSAVPFFVLLLIGPVVGLVWGATTGLFGALGLHSTGMLSVREFWWVSMAAGGISGGLQFSWFWLPYTLRKSKGKGTKLLVATAMLLPAVGFAALFAWATC
jgi:hypothetical protein